MSDFAALLANAQLVDRTATRPLYDGPIDDSIVAAVKMILDNDRPIMIPLDSLEKFDQLAEQFAAQARKLDKTASITKVWADPKEKTILKGMKVNVGAKRGRGAAPAADEVPAAAPAESK